MSAFWSTVIGAAAAIVGGIGAALWQTSRADTIAQKIRRAERREEGLLALHFKVADVAARLADVDRSAWENGYQGSQWLRAAMAVRELRDLWEGSSSALIPDQSIAKAYEAVMVEARELLPEGAEGAERQRDLSTGDKDLAIVFAEDLDHILALMRDLQDAVHKQVQGFLRP